jgi:hypothetical protein
MIGSPGLNFVGRTSFASDVILVLLVFRQASILLDQYQFRVGIFHAMVCLFVVSVSAVVFFADYIRTVAFYSALSKTENNRNILIEYGKKYKFGSLPMPAYFSGYSLVNDISKGRIFSTDLSFDLRNWQNVHRSSYVGIPIYKLFTPEIWTIDMVADRFAERNGWVSDGVFYIRLDEFCDNFNGSLSVRFWPADSRMISRDKRSIGYEQFDFSPALERKIPVLPHDGNVVNGGCVIKTLMPAYRVNNIQFSDPNSGGHFVSVPNSVLF